VEKPEAFSVQMIIPIRPTILCFCEVLNRQVLGDQHNLEPNQTNLGFHKVSIANTDYYMRRKKMPF